MRLSIIFPHLLLEKNSFSFENAVLLGNIKSGGDSNLVVLPFALRGGCLAGEKPQKVNREITWKLPYRLFILLGCTGGFEKQFSFSFRSITLLFTKIALETRVYQQKVLTGGCQHPKRGIFSWLGISGF